MPPTTPEQRFEVPPEYAEVYERAYRRAYEEGQGQLIGSEVTDPVRRVRGRRGSRLSRTSHRAMVQARSAQWTQQWPGQDSEKDSGQEPTGSAVEQDTEADRRPTETPELAPEQESRTLEVFSSPFETPVPHEDVEPPAPEADPTGTVAAPVRVVVVNPDELGQPLADRHGHRAKRRAATSSLASVLGLLLLALVLVAGSFVLGRLSVGRVDVPGVPAGAPPAAQVSAGAAAPQVPARASETGLAGLQVAMEPPGPYRGAVARLSGLRATASCTAPADRDSRGRRVSYAPGNVFDAEPATAWLCKGSAVGARLTITLPVATDVVRLGLVPGYDKSDRYATNNRITRVAWWFDDGTRVVQTLGASRKDRSLRMLRIDPVRTRTVVLQVLGLDKGAKNNTAVSTVRLETYR